MGAKAKFRLPQVSGVLLRLTSHQGRAARGEGRAGACSRSRRRLCEARESGQSLVELILLLSFLVTLVFVMINVDSAISMAIVNQQYARAQVMEMTWNSPYYPPLDRQQSAMVAIGANQLVVGVSENPFRGNGQYTPEASTQQIPVRPRASAPNLPQTEPETRALARIRNTVTLCTPLTMVGAQPMLPVASTEPYGPAGPAYLSQFPEPGFLRQVCVNPEIHYE